MGIYSVCYKIFPRDQINLMKLFKKVRLIPERHCTSSVWVPFLQGFALGSSVGLSKKEHISSIHEKSTMQARFPHLAQPPNRTLTLACIQVSNSFNAPSSRICGIFTQKLFLGILYITAGCSQPIAEMQTK
jgi:hypothetical protein